MNKASTMAVNNDSNKKYLEGILVYKIIIIIKNVEYIGHQV